MCLVSINIRHVLLKIAHHVTILGLVRQRGSADYVNVTTRNRCVSPVLFSEKIKKKTTDKR